MAKLQDEYNEEKRQKKAKEMEEKMTEDEKLEQWSTVANADETREQGPVRIRS